MKRKICLTLAGMLLAQLALLHAKRNLPGVPGFGMLHVGSFQSLEDRGAMTFKGWN